MNLPVLQGLPLECIHSESCHSQGILLESLITCRAGLDQPLRNLGQNAQSFSEDAWTKHFAGQQNTWQETRQASPLQKPSASCRAVTTHIEVGSHIGRKPAKGAANFKEHHRVSGPWGPGRGALCARPGAQIVIV